MNRRARLILVVAIAMPVLTACATHYTPDAVTDPYGFWSGIWHGIVFPYALIANIVSWIASLAGISFLQGIQIIGLPNTGLTYYIGFGLGILAYGGAGSAR